MKCLMLYEFGLVELLEISTFGDWGCFDDYNVWIMNLIFGVLCGWGIWWSRII
jgi:hypothetical protein